MYEFLAEAISDTAELIQGPKKKLWLSIHRKALHLNPFQGLQEDL